jgi:hypothetical protein
MILHSLPHKQSRGSSVGIVLGYGLDNRGSRVRFPAGLGIFLFTTASRTALGPTHPPIQWVPFRAVSLGVKRPGREADHSPPSSAEVKDVWSYTSTPLYAFMAWCSVKRSTGTTLHTPSTQMPQQHFKKGHDHFLTHPFQFTRLTFIPRVVRLECFLCE